MACCCWCCKVGRDSKRWFSKRRKKSQVPAEEEEGLSNNPQSFTQSSQPEVSDAAIPPDWNLPYPPKPSAIMPMPPILGDNYKSGLKEGIYLNKQLPYPPDSAITDLPIISA